MKWYQKVSNWLKSFFSGHNQQAVAKVLMDVGKVAANATTGNYATAVEAATQLPTDLSNIKVTDSPTVTTTASPSTTFTVVSPAVIVPISTKLSLPGDDEKK